MTHGTSASQIPAPFAFAYSPSGGDSLAAFEIVHARSVARFAALSLLQDTVFQVHGRERIGLYLLVGVIGGAIVSHLSKPGIASGVDHHGAASSLPALINDPPVEHRHLHAGVLDLHRINM